MWTLRTENDQSATAHPPPRLCSRPLTPTLPPDTQTQTQTQTQTAGTLAHPATPSPSQAIPTPPHTTDATDPPLRQRPQAASRTTLRTPTGPRTKTQTGNQATTGLPTGITDWNGKKPVTRQPPQLPTSPTDRTARPPSAYPSPLSHNVPAPRSCFIFPPTLVPLHLVLQICFRFPATRFTTRDSIFDMRTPISFTID